MHIGLILFFTHYTLFFAFEYIIFYLYIYLYISSLVYVRDINIIICIQIKQIETTAVGVCYWLAGWCYCGGNHTPYTIYTLSIFIYIVYI